MHFVVVVVVDDDKGNDVAAAAAGQLIMENGPAGRVCLEADRTVADIAAAAAGGDVAVSSARNSVHCPGRTRCTRLDSRAARCPSGPYRGTPAPHSTRLSARRTGRGP